MKKRKQNLKGSYSIEASFIMPLILGAIIILIYSTFFLYNCTVLSSAAYEAALMGNHIKSQNKDYIAAETKKIGSALIEGRLLSMKDIIISVRVTKDMVWVNYEGKFQIPGDGVSSLLLGKAYPVIRAGGSVKRIDSVGFIRYCKKAENLVKKVKGEGEGIK